MNDHPAIRGWRFGAGRRNTGTTTSSRVVSGCGGSLLTAYATDQTGISFVLAIGMFLALVSVVAMLVMLTRHRRPIDQLTARLGAVDEPTSGAVTDPPGSTPGFGDLTASGDVLRGPTSYVQAMIDGADAGARSLADEAIVEIHARHRQPVTPREVAAAANVSIRTLERVMAATLDCSPRQLILTIRMREARRLLRSSRLRVSEIA